MCTLTCGVFASRGLGAPRWSSSIDVHYECEETRSRCARKHSCPLAWLLSIVAKDERRLHSAAHLRMPDYGWPRLSPNARRPHLLPAYWYRVSRDDLIHLFDDPYPGALLLPSERIVCHCCRLPQRPTRPALRDWRSVLCQTGVPSCPAHLSMVSAVTASCAGLPHNRPV